MSDKIPPTFWSLYNRIFSAIRGLCINIVFTHSKIDIKLICENNNEPIRMIPHFFKFKLIFLKKYNGKNRNAEECNKNAAKQQIVYLMGFSSII